jgi:hypothetical protein
MAMVPGRELDALVEYNIMRIWAQATNFVHWKENTQLPIPKYSTDISAAWEVAEKLAEDWADFAIGTTSYTTPQWSASWGFDGYGWDSEEAETAPLAICRAALSASLDRKGDNHNEPTSSRKSG